MEVNRRHPEGVIERPVEDIFGDKDLAILSEKADAETAETSLREDREGFGFLVSRRMLDFLLRREQSGNKIAWFVTVGVGVGGMAYIAWRRFLRAQQGEQRRVKGDE